MSLQSTTSNVNNASFAVDPKTVDSLRLSARQNSPEAIKGVAQQFEGLFMNMIMKSMRDATPKEGLFDSEQGKMFSSMLDQQLSQNLAKRGVGLADMMIRQLSNNRSVSPDGAVQPKAMQASNGKAITADAQANVQTALDSGIPGVLKAALTGFPGAAPVVDKAVAVAKDALSSIQGAPVRTASAAHVRAFEDKVGLHAQEASRATGIPAKFMLGQAALESGWGKREIVAADGTNSHNLFGIKAGANWKGKVVEAATTEYVNGVPERKVERFRAYDSYADSFRDYAKTIQNNPRYQNVLANSQDAQSFAQGLQRAGYATDPLYAAKLTRIITHSLSG